MHGACLAACRGSEDAAVAVRIGRTGGEDGHGGRVQGVEGMEGVDGFRLDERDVAGEDQDVCVGGDGGLGALDGVAGAELVLLEDEADAGFGDGGFNLLCLVADDDVDVFRADDFGRGGDDVAEQRTASDGVHDLGPLGLEARAFTRGQDDDCQTHFCLFREPAHVAWARLFREIDCFAIKHTKSGAVQMCIAPHFGFIAGSALFAAGAS